MAKPKRPGGPKQKLSPAAAARKKARDERIAKTPRRTRIKAENQRRHRANPSKKNMDWDHNSGRWESPHENRGNGGKGTKTENTPITRRAKNY